MDEQQNTNTDVGTNAQPEVKDSFPLDKIIRWALIFMIIVSIGIVCYKTFYKPEQTLYCHYQRDKVEPGLNLTECTNLKVVTKTMKEVDLTGFEKVNISIQCSDDYSKLPECKDIEQIDDNHQRYTAAYPLEIFCKPDTECKVTGYICMESTVEYYNDTDDLSKKGFELQFEFKNFTSALAMHNEFMNCKVEKER